MKKILILFISFFLIDCLDSITEENANRFIGLLINNSPEISDFLFIDNIKYNSRLGISYTGVMNKSLLSYDIDPIIKGLILNNQLKYKIEIKHLEEFYYLLIFKTTDNSYEKTFFFYNDYFISPIIYKTRNWTNVESEFFRFIISEKNYFNDYSIFALESFLNHIFKTFNFTEKEIDILKENKIEYVFCKNEEEIKDLTGFNARGIYIIASDTIISTFNCHYHELVHLIVNYKLKKLNLYTHPLFLEGIAVALGGRGGKEPYIINDLGFFLVNAEFLSYTDLLSVDRFYQYDISLNYPVSGLYTLFLIETIGIEKYFDLYTKYSSVNSDIIDINPLELPEVELWKNYIDNYSVNDSIKLDLIDTGTEVFRNDNTIISDTNNYLIFQTKAEDIFLRNHIYDEQFISKKCDLLFPEREYKGEKYLISINQDEINIYNFYSNNLMSSYVSSFDHENRTIPFEKGWFNFAISKKLFDNELQEMLIETN